MAQRYIPCWDWICLWIHFVLEMNETQWWESPESSEIGWCLELIGCFLEFIFMAIARFWDMANVLTRNCGLSFSTLGKRREERESLNVKVCWKLNQVDICCSYVSLLSQNMYDPGSILLYSKTAFSLGWCIQGNILYCWGNILLPAMIWK